MNNTENTAVIVLSKLTPEEKAKVLSEAKTFCDKYGIELITNSTPPSADKIGTE